MSSMFRLSGIGEHIGIDLWNYKTTEGAGLQKALDYLLPFAVKNKSWPYQQIKGISTRDLADLLCQASTHYQNNHAYIDTFNSISTKDIPMNIENYITCVVPNMVKQTVRGDSDTNKSLSG